MSHNILLYAEVTADGYLHTVLFELANKAQTLAQQLGGACVSALLIAKKGSAEVYKEAFINSGFDKVYIAEMADLLIIQMSCIQKLHWILLMKFNLRLF